MWRSELSVTFGRLRTRVQLLALAGIPCALAVVLRLAGSPRPGEGPAFLDRVTHNGVFAALTGLTVAIPFFLPLMVSVVSGDAVAGEASLGTLRYLVARPVGRTRLLAAKYVTSVVFCVAAGLAIAVAGLAAGAVLFPVGRVTTLSGTTLSLAAGTARVMLAAVIVGASMTGLAAIGLFISTLTDTPVGAMAATAVMAITSEVLDAVPQLHRLHPWLVSDGWLSFGDVMRSPVAWSAIQRNLLVQLAYIVVFAAAAWARFTTRDILA